MFSSNAVGLIFAIIFSVILCHVSLTFFICQFQMQTYFLTRFIDCLNILAFDKFISCEAFIIETAQQFAHY